MRNLKKITSSMMLLTAILTTNMYAKDSSNANERPAPKADIFIIKEANNLEIKLKYPAVIKSFNSVQVVSRALGVLEKKHFTEGQEVTKDDLLYEIEDGLYLAKVQAAKATLDMSEATLDNNTRSWNRQKKLLKQRAVSQETYDTSLSNYKQSLASVALARAQLLQANIDFEYTKIKAPISGTVGIKQVDIGNLVTNNPPQVLLSITQNDKLYLDFSMPLSDYKNIKKGFWSLPSDSKIKVNILLDGKEQKQSGFVDFIDVNINQSTSTVKMRAQIDNSDKTLMPGNFIRVSLKGIQKRNTLLIPQKAVLQNAQGTVVFVENGGVVGVRPVVIGREVNDKYVVSSGALKSGDRVIVNNFFRVKPGQKVQVDKIINE